MTKYRLSFIFLVGLMFFACKNSTTTKNQEEQEISKKTYTNSLKDSLTVYKSDQLIIKKLSNNVYKHTSFLNTNDFGKVPSNGMIVVHANEAIVFDTPVDNESSSQLINYVTQKLKCKIEAVIPTHFHEDCIGGLKEFNGHKIPVYASIKTTTLLKEKEKKNSVAINEFNDSLILNVGDKKVYVKYFGEGHTKDNIIAYFPNDNVVFGGCLIKEIGAKKGNLEDANINDWSETVRKLKMKHPETKIVIPGHGEIGGTELFDYTINLFEVKG